MADRPIAITPGEEDKNISRTRGTQVLQASVKNSIKSISPWKKKDSPVEPRRKIRWVTLGLFLLYTQILYTSLSLSLSLSLSQFEGKRKNRKKERHLCPWTVQFIIYLTLWKCISMYSKGFMYFYVTTWSKLFLEFVTSYFLFSFYSPYVILLRIVLLIPLKYHTGNRSCRLLQYNIITTKPIGPYLPLSRGRKESDLVGVWIVWNLEPLASGGQSSPKLIPHIICQFVYAWEKNSERGLIL